VKKRHEQHLSEIKKQIENLSDEQKILRLSQQRAYDKVIKPTLLGKKSGQTCEHKNQVTELARKSPKFICHHLTAFKNLADKVSLTEQKKIDLNHALKLEQNQHFISGKRSDYLLASIKQSQRLITKKKEIIEENNQVNSVNSNSNFNFNVSLQSENIHLSRDMTFIVQRLNELIEKVNKNLQTVSLSHSLPSGEKAIIALRMTSPGSISLILRTSSKHLKNNSAKIEQRFATICKRHSLNVALFKVVED